MKSGFFRIDSLQFKITVLAILILAFILVVYSGFLFFSFRHTLYEELDSNLRIKAQKIQGAVEAYLNVLGDDPKSFRFSIGRVISQTGTHPHMNKIEKLENLWVSQISELNFQKDYAVFLDSKSELLARSNNLQLDLRPLFQKEIRLALNGRIILKNVRVDKQDMRLIVKPLAFKNGQRCAVLIATSRDRLSRILRQGLTAEVISVAVILMIASLLSQIFVKRIMQPVQEIIWAAKNINYKDLSIRIRLDNIDTEMKDLVDALNEMMSRLERSFNYIVEFSSHVSHELKTPLAIIRAESELALREEHSVEEYRKITHDNLEEVKRMAKTIEDLLLLTKLDYQPQVFKFDSFELTDFFKEMEEPIKLLASEKNIHTGFRVLTKSATLLGDKTHLRRLFYNLVNNAIKYTPRNGQIQIQLRREDHHAVISVEDNGVGISKENLPRIFDKFFRANNSDQNGDSGTGLGLSIAQSIAKIHGGHIEAESQPGRGATFTVQLPIS